MNGYLESFADTLKELMAVNNNLYPARIEQQTQINHSSIKSWMDCRNYPSLKNVLKISDYFNCSVDYLFGLSDVKSFNRLAEYVSIAERLSEVKRDGKYRYMDITNACGFNRASLSLWLRGKNNPDIQSILKMAEYFNVSAEYLLGRSATH